MALRRVAISWPTFFERPGEHAFPRNQVEIPGTALARRVAPDSILNSAIARGLFHTTSKRVQQVVCHACPFISQRKIGEDLRDRSHDCGVLWLRKKGTTPSRRIGPCDSRWPADY